MQKDVFVAVDGYSHSQTFYNRNEKNRVVCYSSHNNAMYSTFDKHTTVTVVQVSGEGEFPLLGVMVSKAEWDQFIADVYHTLFPDCVVDCSFYSEVYLKYLDCATIQKVTTKWTDELARRVSNIDQLKDWYIHHASPQQAQQVESWMQEFST